MTELPFDSPLCGVPAGGRSMMTDRHSTRKQLTADSTFTLLRLERPARMGLSQSLWRPPTMVHFWVALKAEALFEIQSQSITCHSQPACRRGAVCRPLGGSQEGRAGSARGGRAARRAGLSPPFLPAQTMALLSYCPLNRSRVPLPTPHSCATAYPVLHCGRRQGESPWAGRGPDVPGSWPSLWKL